MKIAFCGAHGTGKSSLIEHPYMQERFKDHDFIYSISRRFDNPDLEVNQRAINLEYIYNHYLSSNFISARSIYDPWAYSRVRFEPSFDYDLFSWAVSNIKYDYLFYLPIEFELVEDGFRPQDKEYQLQIDQEILKLFFLNGQSCISLSGSIDQRIDKIKQVIGDE